MAKTATIKEAVAEKIAAFNQLEGTKKHKSFNKLFVLVPAAVLTVAGGTFFVVRRFRNKASK